MPTSTVRSPLLEWPDSSAGVEELVGTRACPRARDAPQMAGAGTVSRAVMLLPEESEEPDWTSHAMAAATTVPTHTVPTSSQDALAPFHINPAFPSISFHRRHPLHGKPRNTFLCFFLDAGGRRRRVDHRIWPKYPTSQTHRSSMITFPASPSSFESRTAGNRRRSFPAENVVRRFVSPR
uniref:Uncharacterized protein n=1 Tax=Arundo donax TaxID=35708 RepID=A0A0A9HBV1_ARUDO